MTHTITYRKATHADHSDHADHTDIDGICALQQLYHVDTVSDEDKPDGFVTTLFTPEQIGKLIADDNNEGNCIIIAIDEQTQQIIGYAMNASWHYWAEWAFFQQMIADLPNVQFTNANGNSVQCTLENSYQYGPVCVHKDYRGGQGKASVLANLFEQSRKAMQPHYPILLTFINHINPRSYHAHVDKLDLQVIKNFTFNSNNYYELGYDTSVDIKLD